MVTLSSARFVISVVSFLACGQALAQNNLALSDGFENPNANGGFIYQPANTEWFFVAGGIKGAEQLTPSTNFLPPIEGKQQAFLQWAGVMHRMVSLKGGDHVLTLKMMRSPSQGGSITAPAQVFVGGQLAATFSVSSAFTYVAQIALIQGTGNQLISIVNPAGGATLLVDDVQLYHPASRTTVLSSGFESPDATGTILYQPVNTEWLALNAGVIASWPMPDGSQLVAPVGAQYAFIHSSGSLNRNVKLDGGLIVLDFKAARSAVFGGAAVPLQVYLGEQLVGEVTPPVVGSGAGTPFRAMSVAFVVNRAGTYGLRIVNPNGAYVTTIDDVTIRRY